MSDQPKEALSPFNHGLTLDAIKAIAVRTANVERTTRGRVVSVEFQPDVFDQSGLLLQSGRLCHFGSKERSDVAELFAKLAGEFIEESRRLAFTVIDCVALIEKQDSRLLECAQQLSNALAHASAESDGLRAEQVKTQSDLNDERRKALNYKNSRDVALRDNVRLRQLLHALVAQNHATAELATSIKTLSHEAPLPPAPAVENAPCAQVIQNTQSVKEVFRGSVAGGAASIHCGLGGSRATVQP